MSLFALSPQARRDLREIANYIAQDRSIEVADRILAEFQKTFRLLAAHPGAGHRRPDLTNLPVLWWPMRSFLIAYRRDRPSLEIIAVFHGRRDVGKLIQSRTGA